LNKLSDGDTSRGIAKMAENEEAGRDPIKDPDLPAVVSSAGETDPQSADSCRRVERGIEICSGESEDDEEEDEDADGAHELTAGENDANTYREAENDKEALLNATAGGEEEGCTVGDSNGVEGGEEMMEDTDNPLDKALCVEAAAASDDRNGDMANLTNGANLKRAAERVPPKEGRQVGVSDGDTKKGSQRENNPDVTDYQFSPNNVDPGDDALSWLANDTNNSESNVTEENAGDDGNTFLEREGANDEALLNTTARGSGEEETCPVGDTNGVEGGEEMKRETDSDDPLNKAPCVETAEAVAASDGNGDNGRENLRLAEVVTAKAGSQEIDSDGDTEEKGSRGENNPDVRDDRDSKHNGDAVHEVLINAPVPDDDDASGRLANDTNNTGVCVKQVDESAPLDQVDGDDNQRQGEMRPNTAGDLELKNQWPKADIPLSGDALRQYSSDLADVTVTALDIPSPSDPGITPVMTVLREHLLFTALISNIRKLGKYLHLGTLAVADDATLLIKVQSALFDVIKLCDAVSLLMQNLRVSSQNIIEKLHVAYLYLLDGFPDFARTDIECISKDVKSMQERGSKCLKVANMLKCGITDKSLENECALRVDSYFQMIHSDPDMFDVLSSHKKRIDKEQSHLSQASNSTKDTDETEETAKHPQEGECSRDNTAEENNIGPVTEEKKEGLTILKNPIQFVKSLILKNKADVDQRISNDSGSETADTPGAKVVDSTDSNPVVTTKQLQEGKGLSDNRAGENNIESVTKVVKNETTFFASCKRIFNKKDERSPISNDETADASVAKVLDRSDAKPVAAPDPKTVETVETVKRRQERYYRVLLLDNIIRKSSEILENIEDIIKGANRLVDEWDSECKYVIEPWLAEGFRDSERLTPEEHAGYWKSLWFQTQARTYYSR
jgi:hypothetical protein